MTPQALEVHGLSLDINLGLGVNNFLNPVINLRKSVGHMVFNLMWFTILSLIVILGISLGERMSLFM